MGIHVFCCPQPHLKRCPSGGYCSSFSRVWDSFALKPSRSPETSEQHFFFFLQIHTRRRKVSAAQDSPDVFVHGVEFRWRKRRGLSLVLLYFTISLQHQKTSPVRRNLCCCVLTLHPQESSYSSSKASSINTTPVSSAHIKKSPM